jgi:AraC family transcriptional activator of mtrCDE
MDALSRLLSLYPVHTAVDVRCKFGAPWGLDNAATDFGVAPYHVIVTGGGRLEMEGREDIPLRAGDIIFFPKGTAHRLHAEEAPDAPTANLVATGENVLPLLYNEGSGPVTEILCGEILFASGASKTMLAALPDLIHVRTEGRADLGTLQSLIGLLRAEAATVRPGATAVVAQLASAMFALLMRAWLEQSPEIPGLFAFMAEPRLRPALGGMLTEPARPWQLGELAAVCNMSRATFARLVRKVAGATPAAFLTETRMAKAAALLAEGQLSVGQIGEQVGYQSEAAFNRAFRRSYGIGPGAYRRNGAVAAPARRAAAA